MSISICNLSITNLRHDHFRECLVAFVLQVLVYFSWTQLLPIAIFNGAFGQSEQSG